MPKVEIYRKMKKSKREKKDSWHAGASINVNLFTQSDGGIFRLQLKHIYCEDRMCIREIRYDNRHKQLSKDSDKCAIVSVVTTTQIHVNLSRFQMPYDILVVIVFKLFF